MPTQRARGLVIRDNQLLLVFRNKYGRIYFSLPGGGQEEIDTSLEETVVREVLEEASINVKVVKLLHSAANEKGEIQHLFLCEYIDGEVGLGDNVELAKMTANPLNFYRPMWVNLDSVKEIPIRPERFLDFVRDYVVKLDSSNK